MLDIVGTLVARDHPVPVETWRDFWDRLHDAKLRPGEAVAVLSSLSTRMPEDGTLGALLSSLRERRTPAQPTAASAGAVNIVGTGGGPRTFNISTTSAFVAASLGVKVIKTGSRAYSSRCGSMDLLQWLNMPLTASHEQTEEMLDRFGIACAGYFVYPPELVLLAKTIMPFDMKRLGGFFNIIGPFLAEAPTSAQITGVSDPAILPAFKTLAAGVTGKRQWFCHNGTGIDELVSIADNVVTRLDGAEDVHLSPRALGFAAGSPDDLKPAETRDGIIDHFMAVLSGDAPPAAIDTVCLNAAALSIIGGLTNDWPEAVREARAAIERGHVRRLVETLRAHGGAGARSVAPRRTSHG